MQTLLTDLLIIGGGINGAGIAADAAGRGLSVILCEQGDLASSTSSASSKLIHGGLRYLELYDFKLVHEALKEREILLKTAPHLTQPLKFILPHDSHLRPAWLIRLGLFFYDHLARKNVLPNSTQLNLAVSLEGKPLKSVFKVGFSYFDAQTDDARLVIANAISARANGAQILTRTACVKASRQNDGWIAELHNKNTNEKIEIQTKAIVNASGPWVTDVLQRVLSAPAAQQIKLVKGSHIMTNKLYDGDHAYILQNKDQRIVFVIPYQNQFSLIGTTDVLFSGDPSTATISIEEIHYLCNAINYYFAKTITENDIVWSYAGVRPLFGGGDHLQEPAKISREYHLELNDENGKAPLLSIFGGKITTYRKLAEHALEKLQRYFPTMTKSWTASAFLPGGDLQGQSLTQFIAMMQHKYSWLPSAILSRYAHSYGSMLEAVLDNATCLADMGEDWGAGLYEKEIHYLLKNEWAQTVDDIIWRRSKLGLFLTPEQKARVL